MSVMAGTLNYAETKATKPKLGGLGLAGSPRHEGVKVWFSSLFLQIHLGWAPVQSMPRASKSHKGTVYCHNGSLRLSLVSFQPTELG